MKLHPQPGPGHCHTVRVYYEDTDAGGVVYHANYLRFAERARTEALREMGVPHAELVSQHGLMFMVRRVNLDYLVPARLDDSLVVVTLPLEVGAASLELRQNFWRADALLVSIGIRLACVRIADARPARMPPRWRTALSGMALAGTAGLETAPIGAQ